MPVAGPMDAVLASARERARRQRRATRRRSRSRWSARSCESTTTGRARWPARTFETDVDERRCRRWTRRSRSRRGRTPAVRRAAHAARARTWRSRRHRRAAGASAAARRISSRRMGGVRRAGAGRAAIVLPLGAEPRACGARRRPSRRSRVPLPAGGARACASCRARRRTWFAPDALATLLQSAPSRRRRRVGSHGLSPRGPAPRARTARREHHLRRDAARRDLQVPASGQPILLMADRQTTGGYPKIATVITADMPLAGQLAPGDCVAVRRRARARRRSRRSSRASAS